MGWVEEVVRRAPGYFLFYFILFPLVFLQFPFVFFLFLFFFVLFSFVLSRDTASERSLLSRRREEAAVGTRNTF